MKQQSVIDSIDSLEFLFRQGNRPAWTINRGTSVNSKAGEIISRNTDLIDMDESWELLKSTLAVYKAGLFKIFCTDKAGNTNGNTYWFSTGVADNVPPTVNGIPGMPIISEYDARIGSIVQKEVDRQKEMWELNKKIEDMQAVQDGKQTFTDRIGAMLEQSFPQLIEIVLPAIIQKFTGMKPQPNIAGLEESTIQPDNDDHIVDALKRIEDAGIDINNVLPKLAKMVEDNPVMIKGFLNSL